MRTMAAGEFKAKCLGVMAEVNSTGHPVLVTKRGKPLARVLPVEEPAPKESPEAIFGCLRHMGTITGDIELPELDGDEWSRWFDEEWNRAVKGEPE